MCGLSAIILFKLVAIYMWCARAKWVGIFIFVLFSFCLIFWHFLLGYYLSFALVKTPWWLGNWFLRNSILSECKNNKKQRNYLICLAVYLVFASSDSFCLIDSHILNVSASMYKDNIWNGKHVWSSFVISTRLVPLKSYTL